MVKDYTVPATVKLPLTMIQEVDSLCTGENKIFSDRSDAIRSLLSIALFIEKNKTEIKDPKFVEDMNQLIKQEKYMDWINTLSPSQCQGLTQLIKIREENYQKKLVNRI